MLAWKRPTSWCVDLAFHSLPGLHAKIIGSMTRWHYLCGRCVSSARKREAVCVPIRTTAPQMSRCTTLTRQSALLEFLRCSHLALPASFHRPVFHNKPFRPIQCFPLPLNFVPLRGNLAWLRRRSSSFSAHLPDQ